MLELASLVGLAPTEVRLCGGGARSEVWRQVISDVFQLPLLSTPDPDAGLRGAAISGLSAAAAISVEDLAALWSKDLVATNPVSSVADRYDALSANYRLARQSLLDQGVDGALFDTMARLSQD
jgi:xylulokinase